MFGRFTDGYTGEKGVGGLFRGEIEKYEIEQDYWVTLHVLLDFEFNFLRHKALFNMSSNFTGPGFENIHIFCNYSCMQRRKTPFLFHVWFYAFMV